MQLIMRTLIKTGEIPNTVPKGKYSALAILDIGEDASLEAIERMIEVE